MKNEPVVNGAVSSVGIIGGLLSFLIVFFLSQSYTRLWEQYRNSMALGRTHHDSVTMIH